MFAQMGSSDTSPVGGERDQSNIKNESNKQVNASSGGGCPVLASPRSNMVTPPSGGGCPVIGVNPGNQMAPSPNVPTYEDQKIQLDQRRQASSIPMARQGDDMPAPSGQGTWMYPSQQMFYNAMKRKGWNPDENDMNAVVAIHNAVNERAWREVLMWEAHQGKSDACGGPKLVRFKGRPKDFSPKARFLNMLGYKLPFDRHDWIVDRCGREVRYVIDFYNAAPMPHMPAAVHLDVRPALDSPELLWERVCMQFKWMWSGRWRQ